MLKTILRVPSLPEIDALDRQISSITPVIGIYGVSGCGKSFILNSMRQQLNPNHYVFFEGSEKISSQVPGGLPGFLNLDEEKRQEVRSRAIESIASEGKESSKTAIMTGHLGFWSSNRSTTEYVYTAADLNTLTHIIYLDIPVNIIVRYREGDESKTRQELSKEELCQWQEAEITTLHKLCTENGIVLSIISDSETVLADALAATRFFHRAATAQSNGTWVGHEARTHLADLDAPNLDTVLLLDGDKTLAPDDTGLGFYRALAMDETAARDGQRSLRRIFCSPLGYTLAAFEQATVLYEQAADDSAFNTVCNAMAQKIEMYPEFVSLLGKLAEVSHAGAIVVTCGLGQVWHYVIRKYGLSDKVKVIGGGRFSDGFVVTPADKASIVSIIRDATKAYIWAFGDSPLDIPMLKAADEAVVVVGEPESRSSSMLQHVSVGITMSELEPEDSMFRPQQLVVGPSRIRIESQRDPQSSPKPNEIPVMSYDHETLCQLVLSQQISSQIIHATDESAAKLLTSPTRDASVNGPALRAAHSLVGRYIATVHISKLIGLEEYSIRHVQGHETQGHRLAGEARTSIVALMRGGEPLALGINEVFPQAMFVHAATPTDLQLHHVEGQDLVILADSVINSGKSVRDFIQRVRQLRSQCRIVIAAGVTQAHTVARNGDFARMLRRYDVSVVTLRVSDNKFTGTKGTDTGNRLYNTTHLA